VKTDGWGISAAGVAGDENKLNAALALIDYAYSPAGTIRMSYGPDEFIKTKEDGSYETFDFNGQQMPVIADATWTELWEKAGGNYTNYARQFLGSTLSFMKSQAFEFQCTTEAGREGAGKISKAIALGTIKHPELALAENPWYTSVPTVLPTTKAENDELGGFTDLTSKFQGGKDQENILVDIIAKGFTVEGMGSAEEAATYVADNMKGSQYLIIKEGAWEALLDYAEEME
jgi:putative aldouronate transport system substrate-binding protein